MKTARCAIFELLELAGFASRAELVAYSGSTMSSINCELERLKKSGHVVVLAEKGPDSISDRPVKKYALTGMKYRDHRFSETRDERLGIAA